MMILFHILIALSSILWTTYICLRPSEHALHINYALIAMTISSGAYLVVSLHANLIPSCVTGLIYIAAVLVGTFLAHHKLVKITT